MREIINKLFNNIADKFNNLSNIQRLLTYIILLIVLVFFVYILSNMHIRKGIIDYKTFNFESVKNEYAESEDRMVYLQSEEILNNIISAYFGNYIIDGKKVKLNDYYKNVLYVDYKNNISNRSFKNIIKEISENYKIEYSIENPYDLKDTSIIEKVYIFDKDEEMYMVNINLNNNQYYFGIKILNGRYTIFYIGK